MNIGALGDKKVLGALLLPSWLSGLIAVTCSILLIVGSIALTHLGNTVQQSVLGLQHVYIQSPIGTKTATVSDNFASNIYLNDVLLFLLWGSVGLMVYSIVQGILAEIKKANDLIHVLHYVHANRQKILRDAFERESVKVVAFVCWWLLFRYAIYTFAPYTIAAAHTLAIHPIEISAWLRSIYAAILCTLTLHVLTVLLRLALLRPRVFGIEFEE